MFDTFGQRVSPPYKLIGLLGFKLVGNRKGRTKAFQPAQHAPMTLVAFDVAAYVLIVCAVLRAHDLQLRRLDIDNINWFLSHGG